MPPPTSNNNNRHTTTSSPFDRHLISCTHTHTHTLPNVPTFTKEGKNRIYAATATFLFFFFFISFQIIYLRRQLARYSHHYYQKAIHSTPLLPSPSLLSHSKCHFRQLWATKNFKERRKSMLQRGQERERETMTHKWTHGQNEIIKQLRDRI